jgi:hypothetical protein
MIRLILLTSLVFMLQHSFAQQTAPISFTYEPSVGGEIKQRGSIQLAFPLLRAEHNRLIVSPQYRFLQTGYSFPIEETRFAQTSLRFIWQHELNDRWNLNWVIAPAFASTSGNYSPEALTGMTTVRFNWKKSERITYILGFSYAQRFSGNLLIPVAGFRWTPTERATYTGTLPLWFRAEWAVRPTFHTGFFSGGNGYNAFLPNNAQYKYIWLQERNVGWFASLKTTRNWWVSLDAGYKLRQKLRVYAGMNRNSWQIGTPLSGSRQTPDYEYASKGLFLRFSVFFRLDKNLLFDN